MFTCAVVANPDQSALSWFVFYAFWAMGLATGVPVLAGGQVVDRPAPPVDA